jgi:hypothetical protein
MYSTEMASSDMIYLSVFMKIGTSFQAMEHEVE